MLTAVSSALRQLFRHDSKSGLKSLSDSFFYRKIHVYFFPDKVSEGLFFATTCALNISRFCYTGVFFILLVWTELLPIGEQHSWFIPFLSIFFFIIFAFVMGDFIPRIFGTRYPNPAISICGPFASLFMLLTFPIIYVFLKAFMGISQMLYFEDIQEAEAQVRQEIIDIIQDAKVTSGFDAHEKKLIESVVSFRERIAREVMVPRVDLFSLPAETTIRDAANLLQAEGYSRTPVYKQSVDNIVGVLMYKDILTKYMEFEQKRDPKILETPIGDILKNVLYTPETKKISNLLQEFRKQQVHLAIVVDEYGGTEGIVTIEDILEEIVGEIADEYDEKEALFTELPDGGWRVDARMNILDVEEFLDIEIPQEGEYDTIGGYIFHRTGSIPSKGVVIHHDTFDLEILSSNDRSVDEVRITPILKDKG